MEGFTLVPHTDVDITKSNYYNKIHSVKDNEYTFIPFVYCGMMEDGDSLISVLKRILSTGVFDNEQDLENTELGLLIKRENKEKYRFHFFAPNSNEVFDNSYYEINAVEFNRLVLK